MTLSLARASIVVSMLFTAGQSVPAADPQSSSTGITEKRERDVRGQLIAQLADNSKLHGAWLELVVAEDRGSCTIVPVFDVDRVEEQKSELTTVLKRILGDVSYKVGSHRTYPVSKFTEALKVKIAGDPALSGCLIAGAFFQPAEGDGLIPDLMLLGRYTRSDQQARIQILAITVQKEMFADALKDISVKTDRLTADLTAQITPERETDIRGRVAAAMAQNAKLQGAWVEVMITEDRGSFDLAPTLDEDRAEEQQAELTVVLKEILGDVKYVISPHRTRPITRFIESLQDMADSQPALSGCLITGAFFQSPEGEGFTPDLMVLGRYARSDQQGYIQIAAIAAKEAMFAEGMKDVAVKTDQMRMVEPAPEIASYMFGRGVNAFRRNDYEEAHKAFEKSVLEGPERLDYKYWRIVTEIAQGDFERAYKHLRPLVASGRSRSGFFSGEYRAVLRSLEQVQGPVRQKLDTLEVRALFEGESGSL